MADVNASGAGSSNAPAVDESGVPYKNRFEEMKRKLQETSEELEALRSEGIDPDEPKRTQPDEELQELVKNPKEYTARVYQEIQTQAEVPQAISWLESQKDYDKNEVLKVIRENNLDFIPSPMKQAKAAWSLIEKERLQRELNDSKTRSTNLSNNLTEPPGRTVPSATNKMKRSELISQLREAEFKGDSQESVRILGLLEDARS